VPPVYENCINSSVFELASVKLAYIVIKYNVWPLRMITIIIVFLTLENEVCVKLLIFLIDLSEMCILLEHQASLEEITEWISSIILKCVVKVRNGS